MQTIDLDKLRAGDRRVLAKAITLIESTLDKHIQQAQGILEEAIEFSGKSIRVGITGTPGVGKSTFIEALGLQLIGKGHKVAVLAVDPSSPVAGGSILGDKTRMERLSREPQAFIRPSPSSGALGGVAEKTRETILLCEAAGYDIILVETVGVGQSEYQIAGMVDFFMVLMQPNAGDELQIIKKGIMELADGLVINKADGDSIPMAEQTCQHYENAIHLFAGSGTNIPKVITCSALEMKGIDAAWKLVTDYLDVATSTNEFEEKRSRQNAEWMQKLIQDMLLARLSSNPEYQKTRNELEQRVKEGHLTPYSAAKAINELI